LLKKKPAYLWDITVTSPYIVLAQDRLLLPVAGRHFVYDSMFRPRKGLNDNPVDGTGDFLRTSSTRRVKMTIPLQPLQLFDMSKLFLLPL